MGKMTSGDNYLKGMEKKHCYAECWPDQARLFLRYPCMENDIVSSESLEHAWQSQSEA